MSNLEAREVKVCNVDQYMANAVQKHQAEAVFTLNSSVTSYLVLILGLLTTMKGLPLVPTKETISRTTKTPLGTLWEVVTHRCKLGLSRAQTGGVHSLSVTFGSPALFDSERNLLAFNVAELDTSLLRRFGISERVMPVGKDVQMHLIFKLSDDGQGNVEDIFIGTDILTKPDLYMFAKAVAMETRSISGMMDVMCSLVQPDDGVSFDFSGEGQLLVH